MRRLLLAVVLLVVSACSGDSVTSYPDYQTCFDDVTSKTDMPIVTETLVECCLDHPINGITPACKDTEADCINFLTNNVKQTDAGIGDIMTACSAYISELSMMNSGSAN